LVQAKTDEQLFERTQEHIRPLIGMIDELNEVGAEDELRVIRQQLTRLVFRAQRHARALAADDPVSKDRLTAFAQGLGWTVGQNVRVDYCWNAGSSA
jgi:hypothetical protein